MVYYILQGTPPNSCNSLQVKSQRSGFLSNSIFSVLGDPKNFFDPLKTFGGVLLLKLFNPSYGFGVIDGQIATFGIISPDNL